MSDPGSEAHLNVYRCFDQRCSWTLAVPTGPQVEPDHERYRGILREHMITAHGFRPEDFVD